MAQRLPAAAGTVQAVDEHNCAVYVYVDMGADSPELLGRLTRVGS